MRDLLLPDHGFNYFRRLTAWFRTSRIIISTGSNNRTESIGTNKLPSRQFDGSSYPPEALNPLGILW
jgi:hypothetical protein